MSAKGCIASLIIIAILSPFVSTFGQTSNAKPAYSDIVRQRAKRLSECSADLLAYAKASPGEQYEITMDLSDEASMGSDYLNAVSTLLTIYGRVTRPADKRVIRSIITREIAHYVNLLKNLVARVSNGLAFTKQPSVAEAASRVKEDLREAIDLLESVELLR